MSEQPKALRLADALELRGFLSLTGSRCRPELRRLHAESGRLKSLCRRSLQALWEDDFPSLRYELRQALGDING